MQPKTGLKMFYYLKQREMKMNKTKLIIATMVACFLFISGNLPINAQGVGVQIEFGVTGVDDEPIEPDYGRGPVLMPTVWQDGYLLDFYGTHDDYVLRLVDATNAVVYSTVVPSYQTQVWLPATLVGIFELQLYDGGDYYFYSEIEL